MRHAEEAQVVSIYAGVLLFEILLHWLLSLRHSVTAALLNVYEYRGHQDVSGYVDLVLPGVLAGIAIGRIGWQWSRRKLALFAFFAGVGLVAITPVYAVVLKAHLLWWWPRTGGQMVRMFILQLPKSWTLVAVFTYAGHVFGVHANSRRGSYDRSAEK
jgi:hypothetical protein